MKFQRTSRIFALITLAAVAGSAVAAPSDVFTSKTGMTIYTFDKDSGGKSNCNGSCISLWPAVPAADAPAANSNWGSIERADGSKQLTFKDMPVYYYVQDKKPGDATGNNVGGVWHVIAKQASSAGWKQSEYRSGFGNGDAYSSY